MTKTYDIDRESGRSALLSEVIDGRREVYGDPREMFPRVAEVWSGILGTWVNAVDVPLMLIGYKLVRTAHAPNYSDNSDDIEGYLDIFRELVGKDMIHARSVEEYLEKKQVFCPRHGGQWGEDETCEGCTPEQGMARASSMEECRAKVAERRER